MAEEEKLEQITHEMIIMLKVKNKQIQYLLERLSRSSMSIEIDAVIKKLKEIENDTKRKDD